MKQVLIFLAISVALCGCESAFPNDKLDNFWKLDHIEYPGGTDFLDRLFSVRM